MIVLSLYHPVISYVGLLYTCLVLEPFQGSLPEEGAHIIDRPPGRPRLRLYAMDVVEL